MIKLDELDFEILDVLINKCEQNDYTSTDIAKILFCPETREELIKKNTLISYRLKKLVLWDIIKCKDGKARRYSINEEIIVSGESVLKVNGVSVEMGNATVVKIPNGLYLVQFFEDE